MLGFDIRLRIYSGDWSVCYLAAGRPVLMQDTGLGGWLPTEEGLIAFANLEEAIEGIEAINADYDGHRRAARHLAETVFAVDRVLPEFILGRGLINEVSI